jgi:hypothetical protein
MMTFVLAAVVLVGALCVATALDGVTTEAPPGVVASHFLGAGLPTTDHTALVTLSGLRRGPANVQGRAGARSHRV